jgi:hypothetical protein
MSSRTARVQAVASSVSHEPPRFASLVTRMDRRTQNWEHANVSGVLPAMAFCELRSASAEECRRQSILDPLQGFGEEATVLKEDDVAP